MALGLGRQPEDDHPGQQPPEGDHERDRPWSRRIRDRAGALTERRDRCEPSQGSQEDPGSEVEGATKDTAAPRPLMTPMTAPRTIHLRR